MNWIDWTAIKIDQFRVKLWFRNYRKLSIEKNNNNSNSNKKQQRRNWRRAIRIIQRIRGISVIKNFDSKFFNLIFHNEHYESENQDWNEKLVEISGPFSPGNEDVTKETGKARIRNEQMSRGKWRKRRKLEKCLVKFMKSEGGRCVGISRGWNRWTEGESLLSWMKIQFYSIQNLS